MNNRPLDKLNWGILSTARINRRIIPQIKKASRSELVGVAGRDPERTRRFASRWEIPRAFNSYEELLANPGINVVYISLPNSLHGEWVLRAGRSGKHVLCEKPLALSGTEVERMAAEARGRKLVVIEAMAYLMHPQFLRLKSFIADGLIGRVRLIRAWFRFFLPRGSNIRWSKELGGGVLWDVGCYPVSFCRAIIGAPPVEVFARQQTGPTGVDVISACQLNYSNDIIAQIDCAFSLPYGVGAEVVGEKGLLRVLNPWQPDLDGKVSDLVHVAPDDTETEISTLARDPYLCEIETLESAVLDGVPPAYNLEESRENAEVIAALYRSARTGKVVKKFY
ncbi:MAG: Gfo/Idh/MocA family oxidoreductase [Candidatus Euphemobacter frigidus]|nr:Gfo/Idh/MocA family oxidoreductase [Candidatus Euphemobacter frigidus]MDP8276722.1 Gfo/Idh/MocA family oxidoreductase [Candidatus Euphemobacter frigidus]